MVTRSILRPVLRPVTRAVSDTIRGFNPRSLFAAGEQGIWLDPSDFSTLFQDAAGTTPVTAVGQPVGLALDKSQGLKLGPEISVNGGFDADTAWSKGSSWTISGGRAIRASAVSGSIISQTYALVAGRSYKIEFDYYNVTGNIYVAFRGVTSVTSPTQTLSAQSGRFSCILTATTGNTSFDITAALNTTTGEFDNYTIKELPGNHAYQTTGASRPTLQQDSNGMYYLSFDGTDDGMLTPSIDFTGTDKMTVWAGVRKLSDAAAACCMELSANVGSNNGAFSLFAPASAASNIQFISKGTAGAASTILTSAAPVSLVVTGTGDISADISKMCINGAEQTPSASDQGTGNFGNYPLYIGRRGGTTLPFNGRIYQLIVRGAESNAGQIAATEAWCNSKTLAY